MSIKQTTIYEYVCDVCGAEQESGTVHKKLGWHHIQSSVIASCGSSPNIQAILLVGPECYARIGRALEKPAEAAPEADDAGGGRAPGQPSDGS